MKKAFLSLAALFCMMASASAQNEVPEAGHSNTTPVDENVYAPTKMEMQTGSQTVKDRGVEAVEPGGNSTVTPGTTPSAAERIQNKNAKSGTPYGDSRKNPGQVPASGTTPVNTDRGHRMNRR